jgi:DNA-binding response OmpR family regulator
MKLRKEKVMLVDSSDNLRHVIKDYLEISGYDVTDFKDGADADNGFNKGMFDICIIDVALKNYDGFKLLHNMRKLDKIVPIIVLSSYTSKQCRIKGFNLGCDDYVTKPFSIEELELRIRAILRRCQATAPREYDTEDEVIKFGNFELNYTEMQLIHPKIIRTLTRKECELLKLLLDHKNKLVPREIILREVWGEDDNTTSRSMDVFMTKLRSYILIDCEDKVLPKRDGQRKVKYEDGYQPTVEICNIHGTGFMLRVLEN